jgi:hypothetical protein
MRQFSCLLIVSRAFCVMSDTVGRTGLSALAFCRILNSCDTTLPKTCRYYCHSLRLHVLQLLSPREFMYRRPDAVREERRERMAMQPQSARTTRAGSIKLREFVRLIRQVKPDHCLPLLSSVHPIQFGTRRQDLDDHRQRMTYLSSDFS